MRRTTFISAIVAFVLLTLSVRTNAQADVLENSALSYFSNPFIPTNRPFKAILTGDETTEFRTTLFSGTTYRIAVGNKGEDAEQHVIFNVYDGNRNLLFSNHDYNNAPYWDFTVEGYMDCIIEAKLDESITSSGFVVLMTGFQLNSDEFK
ncbi:MAG: hypothetical protein HUJ96_00075 [Marinilabiliaceae bacterium]|nr:hypothetical protein [Marinilabiliaceae bacterium]